MSDPHKSFPFAPREAPFTPPPTSPSGPPAPPYVPPAVPVPEPEPERERRRIEFGSMSSPPVPRDFEPVYAAIRALPENTAYSSPAFGWIAAGILLLLVIVALVSPLFMKEPSSGGLLGAPMLSKYMAGQTNKAPVPSLPLKAEQTCTRLGYLRDLVFQYSDKNGSAPGSVDGIRELSATSPNRMDGWGNSFQISGDYIIGPGEDGRLATDDDYWIDWRTGATSLTCEPVSKAAYEAMTAEDSTQINEAAGALDAANKVAR